MTRYTKLALPLCAALSMGACDDAPATLSPVPEAAATAHSHQHARPAAASRAEVNRWLAQLRGTLAPLHRFEAADDAGYGTQITGCMESPDGGMGFHYGNPELIDGQVDDLAPELLLYAPEKNGRLRLVAVEYIVPFDLWTEPTPPVLHGIEFHRNEAFGLWVLHAWIFRHNPSGMFMDWNPEVSCS